MGYHIHRLDMNFIQQAYKGKTELWMFILTFILTAGIFIWNLIFFIFFGDTIDIVEEQRKMLEMIPSKNFWLAVNLAPFVFLLILLFVLVKFLHSRSLISLTTSRQKIDWKRILFSFFLIVTITIVTFAFSYYMDASQIAWNFNPVNFSILMIISLILFPFQIGLEEYLFRGYLMQHIGVIVKNRWLPLIITSVVFGIFHSANPEVAEIGPMIMIFYIGTGLLLGIMTLMDEGIELALGFHLGNNLLAAILITSDWSALQTDAMFRYTAENAGTSLAEILMPIAIGYPIILLILARKYKWKNWGDKLSGKIEKPAQEEVAYLDNQ